MLGIEDVQQSAATLVRSSRWIVHVRAIKSFRTAPNAPAPNRIGELRSGLYSICSSRSRALPSTASCTCDQTRKMNPNWAARPPLQCPPSSRLSHRMRNHTERRDIIWCFATESSRDTHSWTSFPQPLAADNLPLLRGHWGNATERNTVQK